MSVMIHDPTDSHSTHPHEVEDTNSSLCGGVQHEHMIIRTDGICI